MPSIHRGPRSNSGGGGKVLNYAVTHSLINRGLGDSGEEHGSDAMEPWRRMLEPSVEVKAYSRGINHLEEYQRFFHHSLTCLPLEIEGGDTSQYLLRDMCSPMLTKVFLTDRVCTTHQLFGLMFIRQTGCPGVPPLAALEHQLLDNVEIQLKWDPIVRDACIQRLLIPTR